MRARGQSPFVNRVLSLSPFAILTAWTLFAALWPRQQVGQRFDPGGGNVALYDDHELLRLVVFVAGLLAAGALRIVAKRYSPRP
jgi:hypothetical protein